MSELKIYTKIYILLHGELTYMNNEQVQAWFKESFIWAEQREKYRLAAKLKRAKDRYEDFLKKNVLVSNIFGTYYVTTK